MQISGHSQHNIYFLLLKAMYWMLSKENILQEIRSGPTNLYGI